MRIAALAAAAAISALATAASAAPATVDVSIAPPLMEKAERTYGVRDVHDLAAELKQDVERELARTGAYDGARIELVLADAAPTRPTFKQLGDRPGLSMRSISLGGAEIAGRVIAADGREAPVHYRYYENDLRNAYGETTWSHADQALSLFAHRFARGQAVASR